MTVFSGPERKGNAMGFWLRAGADLPAGRPMGWPGIVFSYERKDFVSKQDPLSMLDTCYSVGGPIGERNGTSR